MPETKERSFFVPLLILGVVLLGLGVGVSLPFATCDFCGGTHVLAFKDGVFLTSGSVLGSSPPANIELAYCDRCDPLGRTSLFKNWTVGFAGRPALEELEIFHPRKREIVVPPTPESP